MTKTLHIISFIVLTLWTGRQLIAQDKYADVRMNAVKTIIAAYNEQDFGKMQKPFFGIGKLLISKKALRKEFEPYYNKFGRATIDTVTYSHKYQYTAQISLEKDKTERAFLSFIFSEKGKVEGFGFTQPTLIYPKTDQGELPENISEQIATVIRAKHLKDSLHTFNGCIMVLDNGNEIFKNCYGYADFENKTQLNDSSLFDIASCGKQFTATAIMLLAEQGKLNYADNVKKYIPELPYENITIENLLTHTSGLSDYMNLLKQHWDKSKFATNYDIIALLKEHQPKLLFNPNDRFQYSNTGYVLLSVIIEKVSGDTYADFLDENIFTILGMNNTRVYNTRRSKAEKINNYAYGYLTADDLKNYTLQGNQLGVIPDSVPEYNYVVYMDAITGDGNISSNLKDLAIWDKALREKSLVQKATLERALTKHKLNNGNEIEYGYGFFLRNGEGIETVAYHTGGWPGYLCIIMRLIDQEKTIVVLSNNSYDNFLRVADDVAAIILKNENN